MACCLGSPLRQADGSNAEDLCRSGADARARCAKRGWTSILMYVTERRSLLVLILPYSGTPCGTVGREPGVLARE